MRFSKEFWRILVCGVALILLIVVGFYTWYCYTLYLHEEEAEQTTLRLVTIQKELYQKRLAGEFGGENPYEVLYSYSEALERKDYEIASTYFIKPVRAEALRVLQNAPPEEIISFVGVLDNALSRIEGIAPSENVFSISSPLAISFEMVKPGVWEIQSMEYPFQ